MDAIKNKSGQLTENELFGYGDETAAPPVPVRLLCALTGSSCPAIDEYTGECLAPFCLYALQECSMEAM